MTELPTAYNPEEHEDKIYRRWEESGFFNPDNLDHNGQSFTVMLPPPNVTGTLHMGHALNATIQDILVRYKRMRGMKTLWLPGTDHAGIATQNVVEKKLRKEGKTRHDVGKEAFVEEVWKWKDEYGNIILQQLRNLGASADWSRTRFTMDQDYQREVEEAFLHYYEKGWIYEGERVINWCPRCATSISDLEVDRKEEQTTLYYIKYPIKNESDYIIVATVRPETMLGDAAVAVNPSDERYKSLIGKTVILPIQNREIPIIGDFAIDQTFGTGAVKVTPAHDLLDAEIGERHQLKPIQIINERAKMTPASGAICENLKTGECRARVIEELRKLDLIEKEESYTHQLTVCERCGTTIEPLLSKQWFLKMVELAKNAKHAVESGKVRFHPEKWKKVYLDWLNNIRDWCISRQLWWGHKIPLEGVDDVLDTWFSSALWPFATLQGKDREEYYPTDVLSTSRDIINLWVARMVFSGIEFMKKEPFRNVIIHATVLTKDGKRMSKSKGTGVDPNDLINAHGADATRFGLIWQAMGGQEMRWADEHVLAGKKFLNKIWNASRFTLMFIGNDTVLNFTLPDVTHNEHRQIIEEVHNLILATTKGIEQYEFGHTLHTLYDFFWHRFCDQYLEMIKNPELANLKETKETLLYVLGILLRLLHPFIPFVTEHIWGHLSKEHDTLLLVASWPQSPQKL